MDYDKLKAEIQKPAYSGKSASEIAAKLHAPELDVVVSTRVTELGVLDCLGPTDGETFLAGLESLQTQLNSPVLARAIRWLRQPSGIDVGNPHVRATMDQLAAQLGADRIAKLKALAVRKTSIAAELGIEDVNEHHVASALEMIAQG